MLVSFLHTGRNGNWRKNNEKKTKIKRKSKHTSVLYPGSSDPISLLSRNWILRSFSVVRINVSFSLLFNFSVKNPSQMICPKQRLSLQLAFIFGFQFVQTRKFQCSIFFTLNPTKLRIFVYLWICLCVY